MLAALQNKPEVFIVGEAKVRFAAAQRIEEGAHRVSSAKRRVRTAGYALGDRYGHEPAESGGVQADLHPPAGNRITGTQLDQVKPQAFGQSPSHGL
jgi:hypothetical protein